MMFRRPVFSILILSAVWMLQLGGSCDSDTTVNYHEHRDEYVAPPPPPPPPRVVYRDAPPPPPPRVVYQDAPPPPPAVVYRDRPDYDHRPHNPAGIPNEAFVVKEDDGKIRWTADNDGTFYLYDIGKDFVRYTGTVHRGQEVIIMPGDDIVYVNQVAVSHENLRRDARHRIYFAPGIRDRGAEADRGDGRKTGGAGDPGRTVPKGAVLLNSGTGDLVINGAKNGGTVYVYDEDARNVIYAVDIDRGNSFQMFVNKGYINVNSKHVADVKFPRGHRFSLYIK
ncbi:MAG TPA: hypothetical protein VHS31_07895 [Tepidisphaeraceae bacterium]|nr:hypothetical protein [Tepidisphaeraceae bacterium]